MAKILLGVSGGIAAYKALELVRLATGSGHSVRVLQTPTSTRFVGTASFEALTGAPVLVQALDEDPARGAFPGEDAAAHEPIAHLEIASKADVLLIATASANTIAKLAHGLADNILSGCALAARCPVIVAPAMNNHMYSHPATQANVATLRARGVTVLEPREGRLASKGEHGLGRMPEPAELLRACEQHARGGDSPWAGVRVLVTCGGTREPIDEVRFIGNRSSGRMGLALAEAALARGAQVTVLAANVSLPRPRGATWLETPTAAEMQRCCERELGATDVLLMAAAVADFKPSSAAEGKIKKQSRSRLALDLEPTADILQAVAGKRTDGQTIIGFAAEHGTRAAELAREKLNAKRLDAIVVNDISRRDIGFEAQENEVTILAPSWELHIEKGGKREVAESILDAVQRMRGERFDRR